MTGCSMCAFVGINPVETLRHIVKNHKDNPGFSVRCQFLGCGATYSKWHSYKQHLRRSHKDAVPPNTFQDPLHPEEPPHNPDAIEAGDEINVDINNEAQPQENMEVDDGESVSAVEMHLWRAGKFLITLRDEGNIPQNAVNLVIQGMDELLDSYLDKIHAELKEKRNDDRTVSLDDINTVIEGMKERGIFEGVNSKYLLEKFLASTGKVEPVKVVVGKVVLWSKSTPPQVIERDACAYILPFEASLKQLLSHPEILSYVEKPVENLSETFKDIQDGSVFKSHPIFSVVRGSLVIIFYYDDLQTSNPLGSKKHKFSMFYWVLGNVPAHLRSSLRAVNLYSIVQSKYLKMFGTEKILSSLISELKKLETEGFDIEINGQVNNFKGSLLFVTADTPAAQLLAGFKESVANAASPCRRCFATQDSMQNHFIESAFDLRRKDTHAEQVRIVTDVTVTKETAKHWSKVYGITGGSVFSELNHFDVTQGFVHDLMHISLEGILPLEVKLFLRYVILERKLVSLKKVNQCIRSFDYQHLKRDRPSEIEEANLENSLRQNSLQMLALGHVLPFLLKSFIESDSEATERLQNIVLFIQINNLALSFQFVEDDVALLEHMIVKHHTCFRLLYPEVRLTPKFHYLIHLPNQMLQYVPLRYTWCMRFEAAHAYFKRLMAIVLSYRNPPFTMCSRHSSKRAGQLLTFPGKLHGKFLDLGDKVQPGSSKLVGNHVNKDILKNALPTLTNNDLVMETKSVTVKGSRYCFDSVILISREHDEFPSFGIVKSIVVYGDEKILIYQLLETLYFECDLNAFKVSQTETPYRAISVKKLPFPHPLSIWKCLNESYIIWFNAIPEFMG